MRGDSAKITAWRTIINPQRRGGEREAGMNGTREYTTYTYNYIGRPDADISCVISFHRDARGPKSRSYSKLSYFRSILRDSGRGKSWDAARGDGRAMGRDGEEGGGGFPTVLDGRTFSAM